MREKWKIFEKKYLYYILIGLIFFTFVVTRLWRNMIIPNGLHIDEAAMAYGAYSLVNYGVDRYLKSWSVYMLNFDGGQSILYCYLCAFLFKLFDFSLWLVRLPAVIFSFFTLIFGMLLVKKAFPGKPLLMFAAGGIILICPYFIQASRFGLDCNLMLGMSTIFLYVFTWAMDTGKYRWFILAGITGGLVLYTYAISYLVLPIFLLFAVIYDIRIRKFSFVKWLSMAIPMGLLAFPLVLEQYINVFDLEEIHLGIFTITKMSGYRVGEIGHFQWKSFVETLKSIFIGDRFPYNSIPGYPTLYYVTIPLAALGLMHALFVLGKSIKEREFTPLVFPLFWFLAMLLVVSSVLSPNTNKVNGAFFVTVFLVVEGVDLLLKTGKKWGKIVVALCGVLYCVGFIRFGTYYYFGGYSADYISMPYFDITVKDAVDFLEEHPQYKHRRTYMAEPSVYFAISTLASPYDLMMGENDFLMLDYYYCGSLDIPEDGCNYIVRDIYPEYAQTLRDLGYTEIQYFCYSLFYQEE